MSASRAVAVIPSKRPEPKEPPVKKRPLKCARKPGIVAQKALRDLAWEMVENGYSYREAQELLRLSMIRVALKRSKDVKTTAATRLGISRNHLDNYFARGKELL